MSMLPVDLESALQRAFERHLKAQGGSGESGSRSTPENLSDAMAYSLLAPGKRIRPRLVLACAKMLGLLETASLPAALAIEMVHCFTLIHDDLPCMDDDDYRRGRPSNHKKFGEALALLAGDALMPLALDVFFEAQPHVPAEPFAAALKRLIGAMGPRGVIGGQAAELLVTPDNDPSIDDLLAVHAMKTGALFHAALLMTKDLAGIPDDSSQGLAIDLFARELGLAFQVADDLEDAEDVPTPTSILHYLPRAEAQSMTLQRLNSAKRTLQSTFEHAAQPLGLIADEVAKRISSGTASSKSSSKSPAKSRRTSSKRVP